MILYEVPDDEEMIYEAPVTAETPQLYRVSGGSSGPTRFVPKAGHSMRCGHSTFFRQREAAEIFFLERLQLRLEETVTRIKWLDKAARKMGVVLPIHYHQLWSIIEEYQELIALRKGLDDFFLAGGNVTDYPEYSRLRHLETRFNLNGHEILKSVFSPQNSFSTGQPVAGPQ